MTATCHVRLTKGKLFMFFLLGLICTTSTHAVCAFCWNVVLTQTQEYKKVFVGKMGFERVNTEQGVEQVQVG